MEEGMKGSTILCIEDDEDIRIFACKVLELEGYKCLQAKTSDEAYTILSENKIDLIALDLTLDDSGGWAFLQELKNLPEISTIPVIVCTTSPGQSQKDLVMEMGAVDYLVKPLSANILREAVTRVLPI